MKFVFAPLLSLFVFLPFSAFPSEDNLSEAGCGFYVVGSYRPSTPIFSDLKVEEPFGVHAVVEPLSSFFSKAPGGTFRTDIDLVMWESFLRRVPEDALIMTRSQDYNSSPFGLAFASGYRFDNMLRVELEVGRENFSVTPDSREYENQYVIGLGFSDEDSYPVKLQSRFVLENTGVEVFASTLNICQDFSIVSLPADPYGCVGLGMEVVNHLGVYTGRVVYQGKVGVSYALWGKVQGFLGLYYRKQGGDGGLNIDYAGSEHYVHEREESEGRKYAFLNSPSFNMRMSYVGVEVGVRVSV